MSPNKTATTISPNKTFKNKNQFELMEERIVKLKQYQEYYTQNWSILKSFKFDFNLIEFRFQELLANLRSKETTYECLVESVSKMKAIKEGVNKERNTLKLQFMIFTKFPRVSL